MKLQAEHISLAYDGEKILHDFSLSLREGEFVSVVGPSGCGKSTLLAAIAGTHKPTAGTISVNGRALVGISQHVSLMPQDDLLLPWLTVLDNVCLYGKIHGGLADLRRRAREALPLFGLEGYEKRLPHELSGGMRQRAAFLRTALCPTDVLLLDEPFASLDVITREDMQDWLYQLRSQLRRTVLLVTHDIDEAIYLSDRVLVLGDRPARLLLDCAVEETERSRDWLLAQTSLRRRIYEAIRQEASDAAL